MKTVPTVEKLSELIGRFYDAALEDRQWQPLLADLSATFGSDQALIPTVDSVPLPAPFVVSEGIDLELIAKWDGSKEETDPWYQAIQSIEADTSYRGLDLCSSRTLHQSAFFADVLRPLDIQHTLGGIAVEDLSRNWGVAIYRSKRAGRFSREQKRLFSLLTPHFSRALAIRRTLTIGRERQQAFSQALETSRLAACILDFRGNLRWLNRKAEAVAFECDGIAIRYGTFRLWDFKTEQSLMQLLAECISTGSHSGVKNGGLLPIPRPSGKLPYHASVSPLNARSELTPLSGLGGACLVLIHDPAEPTSVSADHLQTLYGLTPAEARLCVALFDEGSLPTALDTLSMSRNTAKTHLSSVFGKLGVSSQTELLRMLALGIRKSTAD